MPDYVTSDQIPERTADNHIGRKVFASRDAAGANRGRKAISTKLRQPSRILGGDDPCQSPTGGCMTGRKRAVKRIVVRSACPESPCSKTVIRTFPVGCELQALGHERSVGDGFGSEDAGFPQMFVVLEGAQKIQRPVFAESRVGRTKLRYRFALIDETLVRRADLAKRILVVGKCRAGGASEGNKPRGIMRVEAQRTGPDASMVMRQILSAS